MKLLAAVGLLLAAGVALGGCADTPAAAPAPSPAAPASSAPSAGPVAGPTTPGVVPPVPLQAGTAGSDGLTVRYQDADGQTRTLRVEEFHR